MNNEQNIKFSLYDNQVSGKQPKLVTQDGTKIMKGFSEIQFNFYKYMEKLIIGDSCHHLKKHIPKFYGSLDLGKQIKPDLQLSSPSRKPKIKKEESSQQKQKRQQQEEEKLADIGGHFQTWLQHLKTRYQVRNPDNNFIILQNLTKDYKFTCSFDIKIGTRTKDKQHKINFSVDNYNLKLNGIRVQIPNKGFDKINEQYFFSKYFLGSHVNNKEDIKIYMAFFFFQQQKMNRNLIKNVINKLKQLIVDLKAFNIYKFISSSVYIVYDPSCQQRVKVKLIDFGRVMPLSINQDHDTHSYKGILNIASFLQQILDNCDYWQKQARQKVYKTHKNIDDKLLIPQKKIKQYEK